MWATNSTFAFDFLALFDIALGQCTRVTFDNKHTYNNNEELYRYMYRYMQLPETS
jgi:hypothetical protein